MKKFLSILVVAALFVCCMAPVAFAGEAVELNVSSATATTGDEVSLTVSVKEATFATYGLKLTWDAEALELVSMEAGSLAGDMQALNPKNGVIADMFMNDKTFDGDLCTVTFKVIATEAGAYTVGLTVDNVTTASREDLATTVNAGVVTVDVPHVCEKTAVDAKEATCTEDGNVAYEKCEECGKLYIDGVEVDAEDVILPALGHDWEWVIDKEPTKEETGLKHEVCANCGETRNEGTVIDKLKDTTGVITPVGPSKDDEEEKEEIALPFTDVLESDWFYGDVVYVYENGLMNGMSATTFGPYGITTRGQIVTILYRLEGQPAVVGACPFTDVAAGSYYEAAITWAAANGIVTGYDATTFGPDDQITREQMAAILYRYAQGKGMASMDLADNLAAFTDADKISAYAVEAMNWAVGQGLINGMGDGTVAPQGQAIRAQAAAILHRFCETLQLI